MNFNNTNVYNFEAALRGMRNPLNSWDKTDSIYGFGEKLHFLDDLDKITNLHNKAQHPNLNPWDLDYDKFYDETYAWLSTNSNWTYIDADKKIISYNLIGPNDLKLAQRLIKGGAEHAKFMRQIFVSVDITAPLYWWKEADTYKVGTAANSTSTMHKLAFMPITKEMFEFDNFSDKEYYLDDNGDGLPVKWYINDEIEDFILVLERLRQKYIDTKDKAYWRALVQLLPQGWLQTRTWTANYAVLRNIYFQRKNHKLVEWHQFCNWIENLPYSKELITLGGRNENEN